jgi:hypothetical protein
LAGLNARLSWPWSAFYKILFRKGDRIDAAALIIILSSKTESLAAPFFLKMSSYLMGNPGCVTS